MANSGHSASEAMASDMLGEGDLGEDLDEAVLIRIKIDIETFVKDVNWFNHVVINCYICGEELVTIDTCLDHAKEVHYDMFDPKSFPCLVCSKVYDKQDKYLSHVWKHLSNVYPQVPVSPPSSKRSSKRTNVKLEQNYDEDVDESYLLTQIRLKCDPDFFPDGQDWSSQTCLTCYICGTETDGFRQSVNHMRDQHPESLSRDKNAPCIVCPKLFARMDHLKKHVWSHVNRVYPGVPPHFVSTDPRKPKPIGYEKQVPADQDIDEEALVNLIRFKLDPDEFPDGVDWSTQTYFNCYLCGIEVDGFRDSVKHIRQSHPETLFEDKACPCIVCPKRFARMDHLKNHVHSHVNRLRPGLPKHNMSTFVRSSTSRSSLKHRLFAIDETDLDDEEDDEEFEAFIKSNPEIDHHNFIHMKSVQDDDLPPDSDWGSKMLLTCRLCHKQCDGFHMAASHMKHIHPELEQEPCPLCSKTFKKIDHLKNHVWRHVNRVFPGTPKHADMIANALGRGKPSWTEEREWPCKRCDKSVKGITNFVEHLEIMHPNQCGIVCPICDKELPSKRRLKIHVVIHSDKKATCPHCGKAFSEAYKLRRHLREVHDNLKDHVCSTCGKTFARADKLFQHELIHVSKSEQPVEWIPIAQQVQDQDSKMSSSDTSSDSSSDDDDGHDNVQANIDVLLETQIKEEKEPNTEVKLELPKPGSDHEDIEWEDESEVEDDDVKFEISEDDDEGIDDSDYVPQPRKSGRKRGRPRKNEVVEDTKEDILEKTDAMLDFQDDLQYTEKATNEKQMRKLRPQRIKENKNILDKIQSSAWGSQVNLFCQSCQESFEDVQGAYEHMLRIHSEDKSSPNPKVQCIQCPQELQGFLQFQIHLWRHFHTYEPPKRGRKKGSSGFWYERKIWTCKDCPVQDSLLEGLQAYLDHLEVVHQSGPNCPVCYQVFEDLPDLKDHLAIHNKEKPTCQLCSKTFFNNNKLRRHLIEVHEGRKNYMCKECGKCFARPDKLRDHEKIHLNKPKIKDENEVTDDDDDLDLDEDNLDEDYVSDYSESKNDDEDAEAFEKRLEHNQRALDAANQVDVEKGQAWHQRASFTCYICQSQVTSVDDAVFHMSTFHPNADISKHQCILCPRLLPSLSALMIHLWRHFQKALSVPSVQKWIETQFWKCKTCHQDVQGLKAFWDHMELDHNITDLVCPGCDKLDFPDRQTLRRHVKTHHGVKLPCEFCGKFFNEGNKMRRHVIEVHEGRKNHTCPECGKSFARLEKLRQHQNLHQDNGNRPFLCHQCGRGFGRQEHVTRHQKICGKKKNKSRLRLRADAPISDEELDKIAIELGIHNIPDGTLDDIKTPCKFCDKSFRNKRYLVEHYVRNHRPANQKLPHRCEVCGKGFKVIRDLERHHNRPHTKYFHSLEYLSLKYVCPEDGCCRRFKRERALNKHMLIHNNIRNFKCEHCNMAFCTRQTLRTHAKMQHNVVLPTESKKGKKLGPRKKVAKKPDLAPAATIQMTSTTLQVPLNLSDNASLASEDSWVPQGYFPPNQLNLSQWMTTIGMDQQIQQTYRTNQRITAVPIEIRDQDNLSVHSIDDRSSLPEQIQPMQQQVQQVEHQQQVLQIVQPTQHENQQEEKQQKKRSVPSVLTDEQKQMVAEEMSDANLGLLCNVCGKIFKSRDALDFHIMYTKLPGHDILQQQRVKNNYAQEAMRISAKLQTDAILPPDYGPPTPLVQYDDPNTPSVPDEVFDAKTGVFVKREEDQVLMPPPAPIEPKPVISKEPPKQISKSKIFKCMECHRGFKREIKLIKHVTKKHSKVSKKKPILKTGQIVEGALKLTPMGCPDCNLIFSNDEELMDHFKASPHELNQFKCPVLTCDMNYSSRDKLVEHLSIGKHGQPCPQCGKSFAKLDNLELHVRSHTTERPFACMHCEKSYKDAPSLYSHMQTHHTAKRSHLCSECGASFMKSDHLKRHINSTHRKIKTIKCNYCDMMFSDKYKAKVHERKHTGESPFMCDICSKTFKRKEALDNHAIVHKDLPKDFKCVTCGAAFNSQQYLNRHISRHFAEKKHKCRDCDMAFIDRRDYVVHINKVHANHRPYGCSSCGMAYKTKQGLTSHLKSHPNGECVNITRRARGPSKKETEKPFACDQCDKKFLKEAKLEAHMKTHQIPVESKPLKNEKLLNPPLQLQQHESQTFVLKPAIVQTAMPTDPNLLPTSLQHALSQHQKAVGIQQQLPNYNYSNYQVQQPMRLPPQVQPHQMPTQPTQIVTHQLTSSNPQEVPATHLSNEFYQHYAANIANFNHMYKQT